MLDLRLRDEFHGNRLKGATVDFTNQSKTGALEVPANDFLRLTYPSFDLLKTIESMAPGQSRPFDLKGARGHQRHCIPSWERQMDNLFNLPPATIGNEPLDKLLTQTIEPMIHRGTIGEKRGYEARLVGWVEVAA